MPHGDQQSPLYLNGAPAYRTKAVVAYEKWRDELRNLLDGRTPEQQKAIAAANQAFLRGLARPSTSRPEGLSALEKAVMPSNVHVDTLISTMSKMYANPAYIGLQLMPIASVSQRSNKYTVYPKRDRLAAPDDKIGPRGKANEVDENRSTDNYSVKDYALKDFLDVSASENADAPLAEMIDLVESVLDALALAEEGRILTIVKTAGNYDGNTAAAATKWDHSTGGSIIPDLLAARSAMWTGRGQIRRVGFTSLAVWNSCIANNPALAERFKYVREGLPVTQQVANYFRLDDILISESRHDTANIGQTASYARQLTEDVFGIVAVATRPTLRSAHFGTTFRTVQSPLSVQWTDPDLGALGGVYARTSISEDHKIVAGDAGFLVTDCIT